jgi:hypothetical protein
MAASRRRAGSAATSCGSAIRAGSTRTTPSARHWVPRFLPCFDRCDHPPRAARATRDQLDVGPRQPAKCQRSSTPAPCSSNRHSSTPSAMPDATAKFRAAIPDGGAERVRRRLDPGTHRTQPQLDGSARRCQNAHFVPRRSGLTVDAPVTAWSLILSLGYGVVPVTPYRRSLLVSFSQNNAVSAAPSGPGAASISRSPRNG